MNGMRGLVALVLGIASVSGAAQSLRVRLDSCPGVALLHAQREDPVTGALHWVDVAAVDGGEAALPISPAEGDTWVLESPPWTWKLTTRQAEPDVAILKCPAGLPMRLRKVHGQVAWEQPDGSPSQHPQQAIEALQVASLEEIQGLEYDFLSATGAVGQRGVLSSDSVWEAAHARMEERFAAMQPDAPWVADVVLRERVQWALATGAPDSTLHRLLVNHLSENQRHPCELLASPAFTSAVELALQLWWEDLDAEALEAAVVAGNPAPAMGDVGEVDALLPWAWWVLARAHPQSRLVTRAFASGVCPDCFVEALRTLIVPHVPVPPDAWTTRSGELESIPDACAGKRTVLLVVKAGSASALRERLVFAQLAEANRRRDVQFITVSIDATAAAWEAVQSDRPSRSEQIRWVGNDPRALEAWSVGTVPLVVVLGPDGDPLPGRYRLPSEGLGAEIDGWPR